MESRLTVFLLTFSILTALILPVSALFPTKSDAELYDNIIRLHVLASSDSDEDQALKLKVRDGVLETVSELLDGINDRQIAEDILRENLEKIKASAVKVLSDEGVETDVDVTLTKEAYPTREYGCITLPSGEYTSLRVLIGEAQGKNWWCVLFPRLCVGAQNEPDAGSVNEELLEVGLTHSQIRLITGKSPDVVIKFRLLEWFKELFR